MSDNIARAIHAAQSTWVPPARPFAAAQATRDTQRAAGGGSTRQENAWQ